MKIYDDACASAVLTGCADAAWVGQFCSEFWGYVKLGFTNFLVGAKSLFNVIVNGIEEGLALVAKTLKPYWDAVVNGWNSFANWVQVNFLTPIGNTAVATVGAIAVGFGVIMKVGYLFGKCVNDLTGGALGQIVKAAAIGVGVILAVLIAIVAADFLDFIFVAGVLIKSCLTFFAKGLQQIMNFNWNQSDTGLNAQLQSQIQGLYSISGGAIGSLVGGAVCGGTALIPILVWSPSSIAKVGEALGEEVKTQIIGRFQAVFSSFTNAGKVALFTTVYKNIRKWIKADEAIKALLPGLETAIDAWGETGAAPWSFHSAIEQKILEVKDRNLRAFDQVFFDNALQMCSDTVLVIANAM